MLRYSIILHLADKEATSYTRKKVKTGKKMRPGRMAERTIKTT